VEDLSRACVPCDGTVLAVMRQHLHEQCVLRVGCFERWLFCDSAYILLATLCWPVNTVAQWAPTYFQVKFLSSPAAAGQYLAVANMLCIPCNFASGLLESAMIKHGMSTCATSVSPCRSTVLSARET
jgi:hypothetical protein